MKQRLVLLAKLFIIFLFFSIISKVVFILYHWSLTAESGVTDILMIFWHGLRLDISASSYFMLLPILLLLISSIFRFDYTRFLKWYFVTLIILLSITLVSDLELYKYWGFRLDSTSALYLKTPKEAFASVSAWIIVRQLLLAALLVTLFYRIYKKVINEYVVDKFKLYEIPVFLFLIAFLIIPIRGGLGIAPINVGSAYFSQNNYLNHAAINVYWNLGNSLADNSLQSDYEFFEPEKASGLVKSYLNVSDTSGLKILNSKTPNILIILLESFTGDVIEPLGGMKGVTPCLTQLSKEGIFFSNVYAAGDRSEKALVSVLSGFPAQPTFSVIKDAAKTQSLPKLPLDLKNLGYNSAFYYGGDLNFANMRSYLITSGFTDLISMENFPKSTYNSKWGSHDDVVFEKYMEDIDSAKSPFFKMIFTLSSHEPFEVPVNRFKGDGEIPKFLNSIYYTDSCLGNFVRIAKTKSWWKNTLIVIVADHGVKWPHKIKNHVPEKFHIPMLWIGGAVDTSFTFSKTISQIDIPVTILNQLDYNTQNYKYSRNIFGNSQSTDAFYAYNNGVGMVNDSMKLVYDFALKAILQKKGKVNPELADKSKAYIQEIYKDINKR